MGDRVTFVTLIRHIEPCVADAIIRAADLHRTCPQTEVGIACYFIQKRCPLSIGDLILTDVVAVSGLTQFIVLVDPSLHARCAWCERHIHRLDLERW